VKGFIYIMSNDSFKESLLKIGKSSRHPESFRKKELETTGVPGKFRVEYVVFTNGFDSVLGLGLCLSAGGLGRLTPA